MGELGNLALVLKFGMQLEEATADFYKELSGDPRFSENQKDKLQEFAEESEQQTENLHEKYRDCSRSDMDMGALEPVSGIDTKNYQESLDFKSERDIRALLSSAARAENKLSNFYRDIGQEVDYLAEEEMERIANRREARKERIQKMMR